MLEHTITLADIVELANERFGDLVKAVADAEQKKIAVGCELHVDAEELLLKQGSSQKNLWGINLYPDAFDDDNRFDRV